MFIKMNNNYIKHLKKTETRVPNTNYGEGRFKPFFILFKNKGFFWVGNVSSFKDRHIRLQDSDLDFKKIKYPKEMRHDPKRALGVVNLNFMFPILEEDFETLSNKEIESELSPYMSDDKLNTRMYFLKVYEKQLQKMNLGRAAHELYIHKEEIPDSYYSKKSFDFKELEAKAVEYHIHRFYDDEFIVEREDELFEVRKDDTKRYIKYEDLNDLENIVIEINNEIKLEQQFSELNQGLSR